MKLFLQLTFSNISLLHFCVTYADIYVSRFCEVPALIEKIVVIGGSLIEKIDGIGGSQMCSHDEFLSLSSGLFVQQLVHYIHIHALKNYL